MAKPYFIKSSSGRPHAVRARPADRRCRRLRRRRDAHLPRLRRCRKSALRPIILRESSQLLCVNFHQRIWLPPRMPFLLVLFQSYGSVWVSLNPDAGSWFWAFSKFFSCVVGRWTLHTRFHPVQKYELLPTTIYHFTWHYCSYLVLYKLSFL
jgi:hypothetical protein